jgi:chaperonin cofactor prefoldin
MLLNQEIIQLSEQLKKSIDTASTTIQSVQLKAKDIETPTVQTTSLLKTPTGDSKSDTPITDPLLKTPTGDPKSDTPASQSSSSVTQQVDTRTDTSAIKVAASTPVSGPAPVPDKLSEYNFNDQTVDGATDELKILLDMFNQSKSDKIELSKHLFNNTSDMDDEKIGKEFNNVFMASKPKTVKYLESIINDEYKPAFKNLKERIESLYVKFLLCFFLLKNNNKKSGLSTSVKSAKIVSGIVEALTQQGGEGNLKEKMKDLQDRITVLESGMSGKDSELEKTRSKIKQLEIEMSLNGNTSEEMMKKFVTDAENIHQK